MNKGHVVINNQCEQFKERLLYIDAAKGFNMMIVVLGHTVEPHSMLWKFIFAFHMPLFFLLSGYTQSKQSHFSIRKRFFRLVPVYIITAFFLCYFHPIVMSIFKHEQVGQYISFNHFVNAIESTVFGTGMAASYAPEIMTIGALWFIPCMFLTSIISHYILNIFDRTFIKIMVSILILIVGVAAGKTVVLPWSFDLALVGQLFFVLGTIVRSIVREYYERIEKWEGYFIVILTVLYILGALSGSLSMNERYWGTFPLSIIGAASGSVIFLMIVKNVHWQNNYVIIQVEEFGKYSLYVLCLHVLHNSFLPWGTLNLPIIAEFTLKILLLWGNLKILLLIKSAIGILGVCKNDQNNERRF